MSERVSAVRDTLQEFKSFGGEKLIAHGTPGAFLTVGLREREKHPENSQGNLVSLKLMTLKSYFHYDHFRDQRIWLVYKTSPSEIPMFHWIPSFQQTQSFHSNQKLSGTGLRDTLPSLGPETCTEMVTNLVSSDSVYRKQLPFY